MKYNISKELFEAVMGTKTLTYSIEGSKNSKVIVYSTGYIRTKTITINDFFFKCKEWAFKQGYVIRTGMRFDVGASAQIYAETSPFSFNALKLIDEQDWIDADSEQQCCFDACQWILDNKDK